MLKKYELMIILKPLLPEDIRAVIHKKLEKLIKDSKGSLTSTDIWGKRHLAYPIKKHEEGYYIVFQMTMDPEMVDNFQKELKLMNDILRFLLINLES